MTETQTKTPQQIVDQFYEKHATSGKTDFEGSKKLFKDLLGVGEEYNEEFRD